MLRQHKPHELKLSPRLVYVVEQGTELFNIYIILAIDVLDAVVGVEISPVSYYKRQILALQWYGPIDAPVIVH